MSWLKGIRTDGFIRVEDNVDFRGTVLGVGIQQAKRSENYFVDSLDGSDANSGKSWEGAFATIEKAITIVNGRIDWSASPWATGDTIHIAAGAYAENLTALPYGATMIGLGDSWNADGENGVVIAPATGAAVDATSVINLQIHNICFKQTATAGAVFQADNFNHSWLNHCFIQGIAGGTPTSTRGFEVVKDMTRSRLTDVHIMQCKNGVYINTDNANQKQIISTVFEKIFIGSASETGFHFDINSTPAGVFVNDSIVGTEDVTLALGMDDDTDKVHCSNTMFNAAANDPATGGALGNYSNCYLNGGLIT